MSLNMQQSNNSKTICIICKSNIFINVTMAAEYNHLYCKNCVKSNGVGPLCHRITKYKCLYRTMFEIMEELSLKNSNEN